MELSFYCANGFWIQNGFCSNLLTICMDSLQLYRQDPLSRTDKVHAIEVVGCVQIIGRPDNSVNEIIMLSVLHIDMFIRRTHCGCDCIATQHHHHAERTSAWAAIERPKAPSDDNAEDWVRVRWTDQQARENASQQWTSYLQLTFFVQLFNWSTLMFGPVDVSVGVWTCDRTPDSRLWASCCVCVKRFMRRAVVRFIAANINLYWHWNHWHNVHVIR